MDADRIQTLVFNEVTILIPLFLAIAVHEWAHVAMARFLGDNTGVERGRYTLNPLAHMDPIWTVAVPAFFVFLQTGSTFAVPFFAAGKPAPYNPVRFDRKLFGKRVTMQTGSALVAIAGPLSNVVLAVASTLIVVGLNAAGFSVFEPHSPAALVFRFVILNLGLFIFNMIPIPPLDGSKVLMGVLPRAAADRYIAVAQPLSWVLLIVLFAGGASYVLAPIQSAIVGLLLHLVS